MVGIENTVVWINSETKNVLVCDRSQRITRPAYWIDPIGANYAAWHKQTNHQRLQLMLETAVDLAMNGYDMGNVLRAFAGVTEFKALGAKSYPMCRALTKAIVGRSFEPNTMSFDELLSHYGNKDPQGAN